MMVHTGFALFGLLFLAAPVILIVLVIWAVTRPRPMAPPYPPQPPYGAPPMGPQPPPAPLDILARRFASGEISADEYQKARDLLKGDAPPG